MRPHSIALTLAASAALALFTAAVHGQWTVTYLDPDGSQGSSAYGISGTHQVGLVDGHAGVWSGSAGSWVDLQPAGATASVAWAVFGTQQVGYAVLQGGVHGGAWSGTSESWVDLHPAGSIYSEVRGTNGAQQVGVVDGQAGLWHGTADSWVNLQVPESWDSGAFGTNGVQQVGYAAFGDPRWPGRPVHAFLWSGTADSRVDLNPPGVDWSMAWGISDTQQVGSIGFINDEGAGTSIGQLAGLWSGTADSWVNLNPAGAGESVAYAVFDLWQAGAAVFDDGRRHAGLWSGTAASWEDLSLTLTGSWGHIVATGIWSDGSTLSVTGLGFNLITERSEALLWTRSIPAPGAAGLMGLGCLFAGRRRRSGGCPMVCDVVFRPKVGRSTRVCDCL